jgi:hypothetical protein
MSYRICNVLQARVIIQKLASYWFASQFVLNLYKFNVHNIMWNILNKPPRTEIAMSYWFSVSSGHYIKTQVIYYQDCNRILAYI